MAMFEVTMKNRAVERISGADAYQQEGQMTTFFRTQGSRGTVDSWSTRLASFRTAEIIIIRRFDDTLAAALSIEGQADVTELPRRTA